MASLVYLFEDILSLFRSRGGWVSSKGFLMLKQNINPAELLLEGFLREEGEKFIQEVLKAFQTWAKVVRRNGVETSSLLRLFGFVILLL